MMRDYAGIETQLQCGKFDKRLNCNAIVMARPVASAKQVQESRRPVVFSGDVRGLCPDQGQDGKILAGCGHEHSQDAPA